MSGALGACAGPNSPRKVGTVGRGVREQIYCVCGTFVAPLYILSWFARVGYLKTYCFGEY